MRRIAFFFIGADRTGMMDAVRRGELPDSMLRGANFFAERGDFEVETVSTEKLERRLPRLVRALIPMSVVQLLLVPRLMRYDAVIASDGFLAGFAVSVLGKMAHRRTKWICVAINTSALIARHAKHPLRRFLLRSCLRRFAAIVCLSQKQKRDLLDFGLPEARLSAVPFGVDTAYYRGAAEDGGAIATIGKDLGRDYATLIEAAKRCGLPVAIAASPKNIPDGTELPPNVTIRYDVPLSEVREVYERARFFVVASLPDAMSAGADCSGQTVLLEALAMGRAVVATERAWLSEYLASGEDYLAVPAGDAEALARAMRKVWDDAPLRRRLAEHGERTVRERYSSRRFALDLARLVERVLS